MKNCQPELKGKNTIVTKQPELAFYFFFPMMCMDFVITSMRDAMGFAPGIFKFVFSSMAVIMFMFVLNRYWQGHYRNIEHTDWMQPHILRWDIVAIACSFGLLPIMLEAVLKAPFFSPTAISMVVFYVTTLLAWLIFMYLEMHSTIPAADTPPGFKSYHVLIAPLLVLAVGLFTLRSAWQTGIIYLDRCIFWLPSLMMIIMLLYGEVLRFQGIGGLALAALIGCLLFAGLKQAAETPISFSLAAWGVIIFNIVTYLFMLLQAVDKFLYQRALRRAQTLS